MSFLRFLALECLRKSRVCMFRCNWTCLVRWPGSILSAGLRAHGTYSLTHLLTQDGWECCYSKPCSQQWHHRTVSLSAEAVTPLWQRQRHWSPLLWSSLFPTWARQFPRFCLRLREVSWSSSGQLNMNKSLLSSPWEWSAFQVRGINLSGSIHFPALRMTIQWLQGCSQDATWGWGSPEDHCDAGSNIRVACRGRATAATCHEGGAGLGCRKPGFLLLAAKSITYALSIKLLLKMPAPLGLVTSTGCSFRGFSSSTFMVAHNNHP